MHIDADSINAFRTEMGDLKRGEQPIVFHLISGRTITGVVTNSNLVSIDIHRVDGNFEAIMVHAIETWELST